MLAHYIQNTEKMVKLIFTFIVLSLVFCQGQEYQVKKELILNASFSSDTVIMGDTLSLILCYRNNTNSYVDLYPKAIIGLSHNHQAFIFYESPERIVYLLNDYCDYDSVFRLETSEFYKYTFNIKIDSSFFYEGENNILVFYHFYDNQPEQNNRKKNTAGPSLILWSPEIKIHVNLQSK